jgi:orotidine-5'-phosphate decarboxylase
VALDVASAARATELARELGGVVGGYKIGLELLMGPGPGLIGTLVEFGLPVFVDAKLHDIPNTVQGAARQLGAWGARWLTVHAGGGPAMLDAAVEGLAQGTVGRPAGVLAVTVLTSLDDADLAAAGTASTTGKVTARRAKLAAEHGCEGVICSPRELGVIADVAPGLTRVTPGIRPAGVNVDDQARVATPESAIERGADWLVIGRAITTAPDPAAAAASILDSIDGARS